MSDSLALIAAWARSAVAPHGGAFRALQPHEIGAPVLRALLQRAGVPGQAVDAVVLGNALGAGGNPARMLALASGLPQRCAAFSVDTQCCSGIDSVTMAVGLLASGQASVVIAGGVEAWSRSPIRQVRPLHAGEPAVAYEKPAFSPDPSRDPDLLTAAADYAQQHGFSRAQQDAYAVLSHQRAMAHVATLAAEIVNVHGVQQDAYPRAIDLVRAARMPAAVNALTFPGDARGLEKSPVDCTVSTLAISSKADGAALVLLATPQACKSLGISARAAWVTSASVGCDSAMPLVAAEQAAAAALSRAGLASMDSMRLIEMHDAFAVQGLSFCQAFGLEPSRINRRGGGLARGHPIGASGAIAMVRLLSDLQGDEHSGARGLVAIAGAGGIGAAAILERL
ncbi:MAG: thiolase family protein [Rhodoferax sp.]|uniref:thiolase family protein n=1 Tax=Rhodoferax sp. TaxID=50421 RepID=UPI0026056AE4|nr:thiolase family protein [Rhodoferax sp.]MDD2880031.1 thiolase family protein [Rhodoferax sp.]